MIYLLVFVIVYLVLVVYGWSLYIRRWHDLGHSGWMSLLQLIPVVNFFVLLYLIFAKGDEGANQYGLPNTTQPFWRSVFYPGSLAASGSVMSAPAPAAATATPIAPSAPIASAAPIAPAAPAQPAAPVVVAVPSAPPVSIPSAPINPPQQ
jgi:hypothetical protein